MEKLQVVHVTKSFGDNIIIKDVSIQLRSHEIVCLLGASGGGKTTLFHIIAGLHQPDAGQVLLDGRDITGRPGQISYMLQKDLLLPDKTIEDNGALAFLLQGVKEKRRAAGSPNIFRNLDWRGRKNSIRISFPAACVSGLLFCGRICFPTTLRCSTSLFPPWI